MHTKWLAVPQACRLSAGGKLDSISLPDISTESSECHTCFCNSGSDLIINVHCSGEFINNFQFLSIHSDGSLYGFPGAGLCTTSIFLC